MKVTHDVKEWENSVCMIMEAHFYRRHRIKYTKQLELQSLATQAK